MNMSAMVYCSSTLSGRILSDSRSCATAFSPTRVQFNRSLSQKKAHFRRVCFPALLQVAQCAVVVASLLLDVR